MTLRIYPETVSELLDRRARKKAQTREQIRAIAHRLFDERGFDEVTIADVARAADVAVQTVFNHFATKEELFFDGRGPQIDAPSTAIRCRDPRTPPLTALRDFLIDLSRSHLRSLADESRRRYLVTLLASESLLTNERELLIEAERRLAAALTAAWDEGDASGTPVPADPETAAALISAMWCSAVRVLTHTNRERLTAGACPDELARTVEIFAADLLGQLEFSASMTAGRSAEGRGTRVEAAATGWPPAVQRAV
jgi:AcrR family transcriptional regulator